MGEAGPYRVASFEAVASTNNEAMARLRRGDPGGLFVIARCQTAGRGRQGRSWSSPSGNLYATLALRDPSPVAIAPQLGFVAGVALARALRTRLGGDRRLTIKWPNDMVFGGAKLAGLLLESVILPDGALACIVGFGVNCMHHPKDLAYPATDLREAGDVQAEPAAVLSDLGSAMAEQVAIWDAGRGFAGIRSAWLGMAAGLGEPITVATARERIDGTFLDLDNDGRLVVETMNRLVKVDAGDVFLPGVAARTATTRKVLQE